MPMHDRLGVVDVVHLAFSPPFALGSYSPLVGAPLERTKRPRQLDKQPSVTRTAR